MFRRVAAMLRSAGSAWITMLGAAHWALEVPPVIEPMVEPLTEAEVRALVDDGIREIEAYLSGHHA